MKQADEGHLLNAMPKKPFVERLLSLNVLYSDRAEGSQTLFPHFCTLPDHHFSRE